MPSKTFVDDKAAATEGPKTHVAPTNETKKAQYYTSSISRDTYSPKADAPPVQTRDTYSPKAGLNPILSSHAEAAESMNKFACFVSKSSYCVGDSSYASDTQKKLCSLSSVVCTMPSANAEPNQGKK